MVDERKLFIFVLIGMILFSAVGVWASEETYTLGYSDGLVDDFDSAFSDDLEYSDGFSDGLADAEDGNVFVGLKNSIVKVFTNFPGEKLKFTSISEGVDDYKGWLYAVLLGMIIYTIISSFFKGSSKYIQWGISIAITAIAMLGIPKELYKALEVQYGAMGSAILAVMPFVVILFFAMKIGSLMVARMTWTFYALYSLFMFGARFFGAAEGEGWPYLIGLIAAVVMIWFIGFFRKKWFSEELDAQKEIAAKRSAIRAAWRQQEEAEAKGEGGFG